MCINMLTKEMFVSMNLKKCVFKIYTALCGLIRSHIWYSEHVCSIFNFCLRFAPFSSISFMQNRIFTGIFTLLHVYEELWTVQSVQDGARVLNQKHVYQIRSK